MSTTIDDVRYDITLDKTEIRNTAAELREEVGQRVQRARQAVDPRYYAREYPWIALGVVMGVGLAIGLSGADRKAGTAAVDGARKAVEGAKNAGEAIADGTVSAKDAVVERFSGGDDGPAEEAASAGESPGIAGKVLSKMDSVLYDGLHELLDDMKESARRVGNSI